MRVHVISDPAEAGAHSVSLTAALPAAPRCWGQWRPALTLGAGSPGGLMLPDATPTSHTLYAPRGVWLDEQRIIVADTGNHRVLIWDGWPSADGAEADVILGQPDAASEGPNFAGASVAAGMHLPTGLLVDEAGRLIVADAWNHRLLVWDEVPTAGRSAAAADHVIGQRDACSVEANRGGEPGAGTLYWPFGVALVDGRFYVADTGNRRVLGWSGGLPLAGEPADVVLGQPGPALRAENRGAGPGSSSFRWPHAITTTGAGGIYVADAGNHRLLRWEAHPDRDRPADAVVGQPDFATATEFPYQSQVGRMRFPYALSGWAPPAPPGLSRAGLAVADTANNRILIWDQAPVGEELPDLALGQLDLGGAGENRWQAVAPDTLCWPYGLARWGDALAVADSGNNRVTIWRREGQG